jgi:thioredoxin-like negative regulator of GroEL
MKGMCGLCRPETDRYVRIILPFGEAPMSSELSKPADGKELIKHVTDDSFGSDVLQADKPVLVDYWAEWCGPCKMIAPILDEVSKDYDGRLQIAKMNVDENREVPAKFGIAAFRP